MATDSRENAVPHAIGERRSTSSNVLLQQEATLKNGLAPLLSSADQDWNGILVERYVTPPCVIESDGLASHTLVVQLAPYCLGRRVKDGQIYEGIKIAGSIDIIPAGAVSRYDLSIMPADSVTDDVMLSLAPAFLESAAVQSDRCPSTIELLPSFAAHDPQIELIVRLFHLELEYGCVNGRLFAESLATSLAARMLANHAVFPASFPSPKSGLARRDLRRVLDYIGDNLAGDLSMTHLASIVALSPYHFARCFKQSTGRSVHQFVIEQRVEKARALLLRGDQTIAEIAAATGFSDQTHLGRHLKRLHSVTPASLLPKTRRSMK